jgi:tryptophan synthase alpha subunit
MTGLQRIQWVFKQAKAEGRAVFMPYHAMGYPDRTTHAGGDQDVERQWGRAV